MNRVEPWKALTDSYTLIRGAFPTSTPKLRQRRELVLQRRLIAMLRLASTLGVLLLAALVLAPTPASSQGEDTSPHSDVRLVPEVTGIQPGTPFTVAVFFEMEPGWHNYWRNAGDSGLPTKVEWELPEGFRAGEIQWPYPKKIVAFPLVDYGYSHEVALLVDITPPANLTTGSSVTLAAHVDWLICRDICLPAYQHVEVELPVLDSPPPPDPNTAQLFARTREHLPRTADAWEQEAEVTPEGYRLRLTRDPADGPFPDSVYFFAGQKSVLAHSKPQTLGREGNTLTLDLPGSPYATQPTHVLQGVLMALGDQGWTGGDEELHALAVDVPVAGAPPPPEPAEASSQVPPATNGEGGQGGVTLVLALTFAFLGGILLNLMPCVFPVLSLKILGAAGQGERDRRFVRNQGIVFGIGVVASFLILAGALVALRTGGAQLGWGFQLQSPLFVGGMAALFFAIGLNLIGVFEIGASLTRLGGHGAGSGGYGEALASGVLATVIATPCTAPFMGAALGFALTRSVAETLLIFGLLGLGMALPYVVLSMAPGLLEKLPRPGPWMETLKQVLAFPMFATVIWLVWVFGQQTGVGGATYLLSGLLLVAAAGWSVGRWNRTDRTSGVLARVFAVASLVLATMFVVRGGRQLAPIQATAEGWQTFSQSKVEAVLAAGQPAFVDFTAAWCLTCQVNERLVLSTESVMKAFADRSVTLFKADWTRQDPEITAALEALGRSGVPVYALYPGGSGSQATLLPAVLTEDIVLRALSEHLSSVAQNRD